MFRVLVIPSAVLMPRDMRRQFGELPAGLFPLADRPMLWHIWQQYKGKVDKVYVVTCRKHERVQAYIASQRLPMETVRLEELRDLGFSILSGLKQALADAGHIDQLYINFADSLLDAMPPADADSFYFSEQEADEAWTYFDESDGRISSIFDKSDFRAGHVLPADMNRIFVGSFGIHQVSDFAHLLAESVQTEGDADSFYRALQSYSSEHHLQPIEAAQWFDVGHNENYVKAKTNVAARSFNEIKIDDKRGILTKRSDNKTKLVNEIRWYLRMPGQLQYLLPRIYDYSLDIDDPYVSMEYYGYHTLHESLLYGDLSSSRWREIFRQMRFVLADMASFRISGRESECQDALRSMYIDKTLQRLDSIREKAEFAAFFTNDIKINGKTFPSLDSLLAKLPAAVEELLLPDASKYFNVIHGDLCFTNILIEDSLTFMRFIDPRGKFGTFDIYGDSRYELAKLFHTLEGGYDFIIEDMFELSVHGTAIDYKLHQPDSKIFSIFEEVFSDTIDDIKAVRLIEATLFLSMIPLHSDVLERQYVMLATGVQLFARVMEEMNHNG